jgi:hypothetical protein
MKILATCFAAAFLLSVGLSSNEVYAASHDKAASKSAADQRAIDKLFAKKTKSKSRAAKTEKRSKRASSKSENNSH